MKSYQYLQQAIKTFLRWLSFGYFSSPKATDPPSAVTNRDINMTEQLAENRSRGISLGRSVRKPPKAKISSGRGGQIHYL